MRILYAVHAYKPAYRVGGPVLSVSSAAEALVKRGHEVTVFTTNTNLDEELDVPVNQPISVHGVEVWYFQRKEPLQKWLPFIPYLSQSLGFLYCPAMRSALDRLVPRVDLVDTHMPFVYPTYAAAQAALRHHKPLFYHQRGNFHPDRLKFRGLKKRMYIAAVERPIMKQATTLIGLTRAECASFRALGVDTPCDIVPNGIDLPMISDRAAVRVHQRFSIPPDVPVILFLGRLHPIKGADRLLDAFLLVEREFPQAVLVMAGPDEWQMEKGWRAQIASRKLEQRVIFPGMILGNDKADMLARADLFCLPSTGEGFSMAILEALASKTAVMISPGCNFDEVEAAGAGRVIAANSSSMAAALSNLLSDPDGLRQMGEAGRELVGARFSWDAVAERLISVYEAGLRRFNDARQRSSLSLSSKVPEVR